MSEAVTKPERVTQNRIIKLFREQLGYRYLGNLENEPNNCNIEEKQLRQYLSGKEYREDQVNNASYEVEDRTSVKSLDANGQYSSKSQADKILEDIDKGQFRKSLGGKRYTESQINKALNTLHKTVNNHAQDLYHNNKDVYQLLRYGIPVKTEIGQNTETLHLIDWKNPLNNDFYIAEEVTVFGEKEKRPDVVLYVNGIAIGVLELKNSRVSIGDGIRQSLVNQKPEFVGNFFTTVQFVFAGNDSEGLKYGTIGTPEKFFLKWKEDEADNTGYKLDKYLLKMCDKTRLIELMYDFVLFDGGVKKLPRVHQYFGLKAAQDYVRRRQGGIIWHTQGSGKSILMVLLAKWILENNSNARVAIVTDRTELDKQIHQVFTEAGEQIYRTSSGSDLVSQLGQAKPRLLCSLVHKFGRRGVDNFSQFIKDLNNQPSQVTGELFVFVDECHRTQSGRLHKVMKAILPNAIFIGFTGTPLLKEDKSTSLEVFGKYIHTYKFNEAVEDKVVLDLMYEARDIDQRISSQEQIDEWFEEACEDLNDFQQALLKKKWGTMQNVLSSKNRMNKILMDIVHDFRRKPRLKSQYGNAILVASSILEACRYYELFQATPLQGKCAVVTSYNPQSKDITTEETGANTETDKQFIYNTYTNLLKDVQPKPKKNKTETYEDDVKNRFIKEPAQMKLLIVVDKLLTGFDAPSCTYLYIDKSMQDHGLFQAICRVNRLDGDDKEFGYIVDYKDLFKKVENAVAVYTAELDYEGFDEEDCDILLKNRLEVARERLDDALEAVELICEYVEAPKDDLAYMRYFCGNTDAPEDLKEREPRRMSLYQGVAAFLRAYANVADDIQELGYDSSEMAHIKKRVKHFSDLRDVIRRASDEMLDLKSYEADMRYLLDSYIDADNSKVISPFENMSLVDIIVNSGIADAINAMPEGVKSNQEAVAETIENNVRSKIIKDHLLDPSYYEKMSKLLEDLVKRRKDGAIAYEAYLKKIAEVAKGAEQGNKQDDVPDSLDTQAKRALYNALNQNEGQALSIDEAVRRVKQAAWRGVDAKENIIKGEIWKILKDVSEVERVFKIIEQQNEY